MQNLVSVIIPCFNAQNTIEYTLNSVFSQTYHNIEVLAVNDGSTDNTLSVLKEYQKKEERLKVLDKANGGVSSARNLALDNIKGDFFCFVDADDLLEFDYIESAANEMSENVCLVSCNFIYHKRNDNKKAKKKGKTFTYNGKQSLYNLFNDKSHFVITCNKLFRSSLLNGLRFEEELSSSEDTLFNIKYLMENGEKYATKHIDKQFYHYLITKGSLSSLSTSQEKLKKTTMIFGYLKSIKENSQDNKFISHIQSWEFLLYLEYMFYAYKLKDRKSFLSFVNKCKEYKKDYKLNAKNYSSFRRIGLTLFGLEKILLKPKKKN